MAVGLQLLVVFRKGPWAEPGGGVCECPAPGNRDEHGKTNGYRRHYSDNRGFSGTHAVESDQRRNLLGKGRVLFTRWPYHRFCESCTLLEQVRVSHTLNQSFPSRIEYAVNYSG